MATIDLGKIKLVWRGTYAGGTAYTVDDVVQHTDGGVTSSFICTTNSTGNAPSTGGSVHSSWAYLAKGHADTVSTTLSTQGDILYRDGSGLQRLAKGTASQVLTMNTGATAPEWAAAASADFARQIKYHAIGTTLNMSSTSFADTGMSLTFDNNLKSTNSIVRITISGIMGSNSNPNVVFGEYRDASGNKITNVIGNPTMHWGSSTIESSNHWSNLCFVTLATVSSTTPIAYRPYWRRQNSAGYNIWFGRSNDDTSTYPTMFMIEELAL